MRLLTHESSCRPPGPFTNSTVVDLQYKSPTFSRLPGGTRAGGEWNEEDVLLCDTVTRMIFWHVANSGAYYPTMFVEAGHDNIEYKFRRFDFLSTMQEFFSSCKQPDTDREINKSI